MSIFFRFHLKSILCGFGIKRYQSERTTACEWYNPVCSYQWTFWELKLKQKQKFLKHQLPSAENYVIPFYCSFHVRAYIFIFPLLKNELHPVGIIHCFLQALGLFLLDERPWQFTWKSRFTLLLLPHMIKAKKKTSALSLTANYKELTENQALWVVWMLATA